VDHVFFVVILLLMGAEETPTPLSLVLKWPTKLKK
jgi:hypothetical protein